MRTTIDLPEELHRIAMGWARHNNSSLSQAVADLMRRGLTHRSSDADMATFRMHPATGLPVARSSRAITADDVKMIEDEA